LTELTENAVAAASLGSPLLWVGFTLFVLVMLALDLGVFHRKAHAVGMREALGWTIFWIALALAFNAGVYHFAGAQAALEFFTGYLIEKALSVDNIFVFLVIFSYFAVPAAYQHRVLFYGILGALVMRALFILAGAALLESFHWTIYIFGGILLLTALKLITHQNEEIHPERNPVVRLFRRFVPMIPEYQGHHFLVRQSGRWMATPLLLVLVTIEATDLVFAVDSIPAIFAVTRDPFIVYTSNIFAILGLRALFFLLAGALGKLYYLKTGLALVLAFVGAKMLIVDLYKVPITVSLTAIVLILSAAAAASLLRSRRAQGDELPAPQSIRDCRKDAGSTSSPVNPD